MFSDKDWFEEGRFQVSQAREDGSLYSEEYGGPSTFAQDVLANTQFPAFFSRRQVRKATRALLAGVYAEIEGQ